ncbi:Exocyst complex component SEC8 [Capsicum baccatum]|uniref:Exocyst complex component Sec8 n=1 Tax=Capsicum baccatum TaxID=33114 RepID=A0A2G2VED4_CAPBA|nr:Exocyst complex component SEC8 [Capsicum baccatum]
MGGILTFGKIYWSGEMLLTDEFPSIYRVSCRREAVVLQIRGKQGEETCLDLRLQRDFQDWKVNEFQSSFYEKLFVRAYEVFPGKSIWIPKVRRKLCSFTWLAAIRVILTEDNLRKRRLSRTPQKKPLRKGRLSESAGVTYAKRWQRCGLSTNSLQPCHETMVGYVPAGLILRLFSESTQSIGVLKSDLAEAKKLLGARNKQLHQLWYRSVTLRHIISLLDQIEGIAKVPARIEKLINEKQFYAAVQLHVQSALMLEREGLQTVGALQDVRSELTKLRGVLFYKVLEDLHAHLYNKGEYSSTFFNTSERDDEVPTTVAVPLSMNNSQPLSRRTRLLKGDNQFGSFGAGEGSHRTSSIDGSSLVEGHDEDGEDTLSDGNPASLRINGTDGASKDVKILSHQVPTWLSDSTPDEFVEAVRKADAPLHVKYLQTMVECLCMLGKVAAAGAIICQRLRPTIHEIITTKIKAHAENALRPRIGQAAQAAITGLHYLKGQVESFQSSKQKHQNGIYLAVLLAVSPVSPVMAPTGIAQAAAKELLDSILDTVVHIFENHVIVGELLESKCSQQVDLNTPKSMPTDISWNPDSDASQATGGYSIGFSLSVLQSECQQLICEILRATPEAASADAAVQTARLASKAPSKDKRQDYKMDKPKAFEIIMEDRIVKSANFLELEVAKLEGVSWRQQSVDHIPSLIRIGFRDGSEDGLTFAFRFTDATVSISNQGVDLIRQGWGKRGSNVLQEGYGTSAILPEQGIYLAASIFRPVLQFTDRVASMLPQKFSQLGNDGLLAFVENFVKDHFLPAMFVDYRKAVQQAISSKSLYRLHSLLANECFRSCNVQCLLVKTQYRDFNGPAAFRPRAHAVTSYTPLAEKGRPILQGLLAIDFLAKEVLGWAQAMPKFAVALVNYVQTFLERTYERCRTSYMEAVLEKQSYMLIGRHDIENLMRRDPASACLPCSVGELNTEYGASSGESSEIEMEISDTLLKLRPIRQENLIRDDNKLILLASLSDSLEYVADSIERQVLQSFCSIVLHFGCLLQLAKICHSTSKKVEENGGQKAPHHSRTSSMPPKDLASFAEEYRKLAIDCLKVLRVEMQLETIFHLQEMTSKEFLDDQDAEEPDDYVISLTSLITRRDEEMAPFIAGSRRNYIFGGICSVASNGSIKALADLKSINLFGVQQICRNSIALEQALAAIPSIDGEAVQLRLDRVRTYYELLNMPFEALLAFIAEHENLFSFAEYSDLLKAQVPGRDIPADALDRVAEVLPR